MRWNQHRHLPDPVEHFEQLLEEHPALTVREVTDMLATDFEQILRQELGDIVGVVAMRRLNPTVAPLENEGGEGGECGDLFATERSTPLLQAALLAD